VPWTGKLLGGLFGGLVGGPLGMAAGAALGHWVADGETPTDDPDGPLVLDRLACQHHVFRPDGPGLLVTPEWEARGLDGEVVAVRVRLGGRAWKADVEVEADPERCALPEVFIPYRHVEAAAEQVLVEVRLQAGRVTLTRRSVVSVPTPVRRLGGSGPARVVMALFACARAGDRAITREDVRFVRARFEEAYPLDDEGRVWLRAWMRELRDAALPRLAADKVAARLARHVEGADAADVVRWVMHGARAAWPGEPQEAWIADFAAALGVGEVDALWAEVDANPAEPSRVAAAAVLGVSVDADAETLRAAWRHLVGVNHPDRHPGDEAGATRRTARINRAYAVLRGG